MEAERAMARLIPLDHVVFGWFHPKTKNVIDSKHLERVAGRKPDPLFLDPL